MYICVCKAVTDNQIRKAINEGACTMRDLSQDLGIVKQCGKCGKCTHKLLKETLSDHETENLAVAS